MVATKTQILKYTLLPEFLPRLQHIFTSGFFYTAYLIAVIYQSVRLLPSNHPYLRAENIGRYGIRHVIAAAANHLVFKRENIDQIVIFSCTLAGVILLLAQFVLLAFALIAQQPAIAAIGAEQFFFLTSTYNPFTTVGTSQQDLVFIILDRVFGTRDIFNSCISDINIQCLDLNGNNFSNPAVYPFPMHLALHQLLYFYSMGIFYVAVMIVLYMIATIVGETAASGTPFGQRMNKTWFPIRIILFSALLLPLNLGSGENNSGLNGAQILTFWIAKGGSNFATNAWGRFNTDLTTTLLGEEGNLIAQPQIPEIKELVQSIFIAKVCQLAENAAYAPDAIQAYLVRKEQDPATQLLAGANAIALTPTTFATALQHSNNGDLIIRFGVLDAVKYDKYTGAVNPLCGEITFDIASLDATGSTVVSGAVAIQEAFFELIKTVWNDNIMKNNAACVLYRNYPALEQMNCFPYPDAAFSTNQIEIFQNGLDTQIPALLAQQVANGDFSVNNGLREKGWAGAAIWYNKVAEMNGAVAGALIKMPEMSKYPFVMETIAEQRMQNNEDSSSEMRFDPVMAGGIPVKFKRSLDKDIAVPMAVAYRFWSTGGLKESIFKAEEKNPVLDSVNKVLGTNGMFEMRKNTDIHPLAQLSALGGGLMDAALRNFAVGAGGKVIGAPSAAALASTFATMTIAMAFTLYYVLPFLPFIYFIFAVSGWVKSIFEAIVAMPLWALAHLTIDGEGIAGPKAANGYFLLFEIFLRPILILFGLIASLTIFAALVDTLNGIFNTVVANVGGFDSKEELATPSISEFIRGPLDQFFYTAVYVIIVYMMGLACFKLIDLIPQSLLRWMNFTTPTIQESDKDSAGQVMQQTYQGTMVATNQIKGGALGLLG